MEIRPDNLQELVGQWSQDNFGNQVSKSSGVELGSIAPLLGMVEETCDELVTAYNNRDEQGALDALGDIMIFMCDFACRETIPVTLYKLEDTIDVLCEEMMFAHLLGKLCHVVLKRHQGIRGYDDDNKYVAERNKILASLCYQIKSCLLAIEGEIFEKYHHPEAHWILACEVFSNIVSKRNWKKPTDN